jgi:crotonobetainyl-CoA:carnitine CoA-transferase CaiB-like acyl-CoA transferase
VVPRLDGPLAPLRILTVAEQYPGPFATMLMSDLGADVIQIERPRGGDPTRAFASFHASLSRGRRSIVLDLKDPSDHATFLDLVRSADVLFEGFRPGTMARLGLDYEAVRAVNPALVYVSISGFGQDGPYRDRPGHDLCYQALAGMLYTFGEIPGPHRPPDVAIGDLSAGLIAFAGALVALLDRQRTGEGHYVDVSMFDGLVSMLAAHLGPIANESGPAGFPYEPGYAVFSTSDGELLTVGVAHEDHFWKRLCAVVGMPEEAHLSGVDRFAAAGRLSARLRAAFAARPLAHWLAELVAADVPAGKVASLVDVLQDAHVRERELVMSVPADDTHAARRYVRQPLVIDGIRFGPRGHSPTLGADTAEIRAELDREGS